MCFSRWPLLQTPELISSLACACSRSTPVGHSFYVLLRSLIGEIISWTQREAVDFSAKDVALIAQKIGRRGIGADDVAGGKAGVRQVMTMMALMMVEMVTIVKLVMMDEENDEAKGKARGWPGISACSQGKLVWIYVVCVR